MKFSLSLLIVLAFALVSCGPAPASWSAGPSPLDTPETFVSPPPSMGRFGPHAEYYAGTAIHAQP